MKNKTKDRFINPFTDFGFKRLFGTEANKDLLLDFLNSLLRGKEKIISLTYSNSEHLGTTELDRKAIFDLYCENDRGEKFIVELQKAKQKFFKDRSLFYATFFCHTKTGTFPIQEQAKQGNWDFELKAVYLIGILDFIFDEDADEKNKYHYEVKLLETETHEIFYDKLTFVYLEMPKFNKTEDELEGHFEKWVYALKMLTILQERPKILRDRIFKKLFNIAEIAKLEPQERQAYERSLKYYRDMKNTVDTAKEEGREEGREEGIKIGREEGALKATVVALTQTLTIRFGVKSERFNPTLKQLALQSLKQLNEVALTTSSLADFESALNAMLPPSPDKTPKEKPNRAENKKSG